MRYLAAVSQSDIIYVYSVVSQFCANLNNDHITAVKHIFIYFKETMTLKSHYSVREVRLELYVNSDWAEDQKSFRFITEWVFKLAESSIS